MRFCRVIWRPRRAYGATRVSGLDPVDQDEECAMSRAVRKPFGASLFVPAHMARRSKAVRPAVACAGPVVQPLAGVPSGPGDDP